jgi:signal peptidase I
MEPTIHCAKPLSGCLGTADDRIVVQPGGRLRRESIVVFRTTPRAAAKCGEGGVLVKRLIGLPGETVHEERNGFIDIDGKRLKESYVSRARRRADVYFVGKTWHVPAGHYFLIGDNRSESCDSRVFGSVPARNIIGPVTKILHEGRKKGDRS